MQKIRGKSNVDHYISTLRAEATFWPCKLACYFPLASSTAAQPIRRRIETYQKVETTCCLHAAFVLAPEIQRETVLNQGRSQDFFRGTHNSPNSFALPRPQKIPWLKIWLRCKPKRCFFCIWNDISNLYDTSSVACLDPLYNKLHNFSDSKGIRIIFFLGLFCRLLVKSLYLLNPKSKVNPMQCLAV